MNAKPRVLVVGCGGIGGVISTLVGRAGTADVHALVRNPAVAKAVREHGLRTQGVGGEAHAKVTVHNGAPNETYDFILLATQPPAVEAAAKSVLACLSDSGCMVVLQNGLCEDRVAAICGADRTVGGIVTFGASTHTAGVFERTSTGGIILGRLDGQPDKRMDTLAHLLEPVGAVTQTLNLTGARFSKLALNCAVSGLGTVAGLPLGALLRKARARNLALAIMKEAVTVSRASNIVLEPVGGTFDLNWLADPDASSWGPAHWARHALVLVVGFKYRKLRSSMLRAIENGGEPAVEFLNGEIASRALNHRIDAPVNQAVVDAVHRIAKGETQPSMTNLEGLA